MGDRFNSGGGGKRQMGLSLDRSDLRAFERKIRRFTSDPSTQRRLLRSSLQAGGKVVVKRARGLVPRGTGALRKSLGSEVRHNRKGWYVTIGPRSGSKFWTPNRRRKSGFNKPALYAHLVEFGTRARTFRTVDPRNRKRRITVNHPGSRAKPFLIPALSKSRGKASSAIMKQLEKRIKKEAAKR